MEFKDNNKDGDMCCLEATANGTDFTITPLFNKETFYGWEAEAVNTEFKATFQSIQAACKYCEQISLIKGVTNG